MPELYVAGQIARPALRQNTIQWNRNKKKKALSLNNKIFL